MNTCCQCVCEEKKEGVKLKVSGSFEESRFQLELEDGRVVDNVFVVDWEYIGDLPDGEEEVTFKVLFRGKDIIIKELE
jgi:hypothetical protein